MFGALLLGQLAFAQIAPQPFTALEAGATVSVAAAAKLTAQSSFQTFATIPIASDGTLTAAGPLYADVGVSLSTTTSLALQGPLRGTSAVILAVDQAAITVSGPLVADARVTVTTVDALRVGHPLASTSTVAAIAVTSRLSTLPATLTASAGLTIATVGNVEKTGLAFSSVVITFNGAISTAKVRVGSITIDDILNEAPNTCDFIVDTGPPPAIGTDIKIGLQNLAADNLLFAGTVRKIDRRYELRQQNPSWNISCIDYTFLLNRHRVFGTWTNVSATTIATALLSAYGQGFSTAGIAAGLPGVTVTFAGETLMDALTQLANLVGGYAKVDYSKVAWLFITDPNPPPHPIDGTDPRPMNLPAITKSDDESQVRTRVFVRGKTAQIVGPSESEIAVNAPQIPLEDATIFAPAGEAIADDTGQTFRYTATTPGAKAAVVVGNVPGPSSSGTPTLAVGVAGRLSGWYQYKVAFGNTAGETTAGPPTGQIFCPDFATPTAPLGVGPSGTVGPLVGAYKYRVSFLTSLGETLPGPIAARTANAVYGGSAGGPAIGWGGPGVSRLAPGNYYWVTTFVTKYGESLFGPNVYRYMAPFAPNVALAGITNRVADHAGLLMVGSTYNYALSMVTAIGESLAYAIGSYSPSILSQAGWAVTFGNFGGIYGGPYYVGVTNVTKVGESSLLQTYAASTNHYTGAPNGPTNPFANFDTSGRIEPGPRYYWATSAYHDTYGETGLSGAFSMQTSGTVPLAVYLNVPPIPPNAHGLRLYRASNNTTYKLVAELRNWSGGTYADRLSSSELGNQYPKQPAAGVTFTHTVYASADQGVVSRRVYRTKAGGTDYFLVGEAIGNAQGVVVDSYADTELNQRPPSVSQTGRVCALTNLSTGPAGVIGRRIYRSRAGGGLLFLVGDLKDNYTTWWDDPLPDDALTVSAPGVVTAGSGGPATASDTKPRIIPPVGPPGTIARRIYRTKVNAAEYFLLAELPDNLSTSFYDDDKRDEELGAQRPPASSTAGGETHSLTSIPIGPAGTLARIIYRTAADGSEFRELARISDNVTTSYLDNIADSSLGKGVSLVNDAGSSAVNLTNIPIGPASVTQRLIFRTIAGGTDFRYLGTINDNTATTYLDDKPDSSLGRPPVPSSTIGALVGDTSLALDAGVLAFPVPGWAKTDNTQWLRYTGISGQTLVGIPATGPGSIQAAIRGGSTVATVPMLIGVTWTGLTLTPLPVGDSLALWVRCDSAAGQAALAATEGGDGVHDYIVTDTTLDSIDACTKRGTAELRLFEFVEASMTYETRDRLTRSGAIIHVALGPPLNFTGDFRIQQVRIDEIDIAARTLPRYSVQASTTKYTIADLLRHVILDT